MSATRQPGGAIIFDGYAPDAATRDHFAAHSGANVQWLQLGSGAPDQYRTAVDFGLSILDRLDQGRFALRDNVVTLTGTTGSQADYLAIRKALADQVPAGLVVARAEVVAPKETPYQWAATKSSDGTLLLTGMVPSPEAEQVLLDASGTSAAAKLSYASGNPDGFLASAQSGIDLLQRLTDGKVSFDGTGWTLTGTASDADKTAIEADFVSRQLAAAGWSMAIAEPVQPTSDTVAEAKPVTSVAVETPATPEPVVASPAKPAPLDDIAACVAPLADFSARNAILFHSGAAIITPDSASALDELAADLAACPEAIVHVEGHTDADGNDQSNLALSVARAEAVIAALVERGVKPARLYALGYGESSPISDNDTAEGKRLNRRIVVKVSAAP